MAKKNVRRKTKRPVKRAISRKTAKKVMPKKPIIVKKTTTVRSQFNDTKFNRIIRSLLFFIILFIISLVLYSITTIEFWNNLFFLLMIIFGFISIALLIVFLIYAFSRILKR